MKTYINLLLAAAVGMGAAEEALAVDGVTLIDESCIEWECHPRRQRRLSGDD